ncbi:OmpH family outer membrane protein [Rhodoflexus caldus]|uniref:OmpH family outer membrane protein n=1 Tax=Rhodoflexus caldus TaxID=2891236 RepID=UPI00202A6555|nr:OmpH family outer membrane protein [Rhodoflexus caldus]
MNNNSLSLILNIVLAVAVAFLYYLHFSGKESGTHSTPVAGEGQGGAMIAYINTDSLLSNYKFFEDMQNELAEKKGKAERQLISRGQSLQQEASSVEKRIQAGLMTNNQIKEAQQTLGQKEQELIAYRETIMAGLMEEEKVLNNRLYDSLMAYLKEYNKDKKYQYIFGYTKGGGILLANDKLDVTNDILKGLNERYAKSAKPVESNKK